jgi:L-lactate dehydrogenase complex protein LldG
MSPSPGTIIGKADFIGRLSKKLGRVDYPAAAPRRTVHGVPDFYANRELLSVEQKIEQYVHNLTALTGQVLMVKEEDAELTISAYIRQICADFAVEDVVRWDHTELNALNLDEYLLEGSIRVIPWIEDSQQEVIGEHKVNNEAVLPTELFNGDEKASNWSRRSALLRQVEKCRVGVVWADYAIAETGTVVLCAKGGHGRSVSLLPEILVTIFRADQLLRTMGEAFAAIAKDNINSEVIPSSINLITGPSRSADIENDLTIGIHGPGKVYTVIIE